MQEVLNTVATNLTPEMITGNAILALALIPAQYLVDVGKKQIECFINQVLPYHPEKAFYEAFLKSLQEHKRHHDRMASKVVDKFVRQLKKDKNRFYHCISTLKVPQALALSAEPFPAHIFTEKLFAEYELNMTQTEQELLSAIIRDCMNYYRQILYRLMNEKDLLLQTLQTLMDLENHSTVFETFLPNIATQSDVIVLKDALLTAIHREDTSTWRSKTLADYDQMIGTQYSYIEFTAGFSPRINARDIRMKMSDVFINLECAFQTSGYVDLSSKQDFDLATAVLHSRFNVFLGDPGCGKTTLLKKIAFDISSPKNRASGMLSNFIPLYFRLADYSRFFQDTHKGLAEYFQQTFYQYKKDLFDIAQSEQSLVFLMDGLDEIADTPLRYQVVEQVNTFVFTNPQYIYFITSRIVGYQEAALNGIFSTYRLEPLNDKKIEAFVYQWHLAVEESTDDGKSDEEKQAVAERNTQNLINAIEKNSSVKRLATNPLLLTIITLIHLQGGRLPNKRVQLYDICADTFLQHWINRRVENADAILDRDVLVELLSRVAFYIHENYANGLIPEDDFQQKFLQYYQELSSDQMRALPELKRECHHFIDFIRQETGIFAEKGQDEEGRNLFGFLHLTFEEYFAAIDFKRRVAQNVRVLRNYISSPRWREIILLCAALFSSQSGTGRDEASRFVNKILRVKEIFPPIHQNLRLVLSIMTDDVRLTAECERNIWQLLEVALQTEPYLDLNEELEALNTSIVYKETLYQKVTQWLTGDQPIFISAIKLLFYLCPDPIWNNLLADALDHPNFQVFLGKCSIDYEYWSYIQESKNIIQKLTKKVVKYLNEHPTYDTIRVDLLSVLSQLCFEQYKKLGEKLVSYEDQLALCSYQLIKEPLRRIVYENLWEERLEQLACNISLCPVPKPIIVIYNEFQEFAPKRITLGKWWHTITTMDGMVPYHLFLEYQKYDDNDCSKLICQYTVIDFFLQKIQIGFYNTPMTEESFIKIFGFKECSFDSYQLHDFLDLTGHIDHEKLLQDWKKGYLEYVDCFMKVKELSKESKEIFIAGIEQWTRVHEQEDPIKLLLAQLILNWHDSKKNIVSHKVLQDAIASYMENIIPKGQRRSVYNIIKYAIEIQAI